MMRVMLTVPVAVPPLPSLMVYWNESAMLVALLG